MYYGAFAVDILKLIPCIVITVVILFCLYFSRVENHIRSGLDVNIINPDRVDASGSKPMSDNPLVGIMPTSG